MTTEMRDECIISPFDEMRLLKCSSNDRQSSSSESGISLGAVIYLLVRVRFIISSKSQWANNRYFYRASTSFSHRPNPFHLSQYDTERIQSRVQDVIAESLHNWQLLHERTNCQAPTRC